MDIKLIVGLGNPGTKYVNNRHNIGYKVIDEFVRQYEVWPSIDFFDKKFDGIIRVGYKKLVLLLKPTTFMNNSGDCIAKVLEELNIKPSNILVVYDDISIPINTIRLREKGSAGGHNGVKSIIESLGTEEFNRLRIGIGKPIDGSILEYVLADFDNVDEVNTSIKSSCFIISNILDGIIKQADTFVALKP